MTKFIVTLALFWIPPEDGRGPLKWITQGKEYVRSNIVDSFKEETRILCDKSEEKYQHYDKLKNCKEETVCAINSPAGVHDHLVYVGLCSKLQKELSK